MNRKIPVAKPYGLLVVAALYSTALFAQTPDTTIYPSDPGGPVSTPYEPPPAAETPPSAPVGPYPAPAQPIAPTDAGVYTYPTPSPPTPVPATPSLRKVFANSLAAVLQSTGTQLAVGLTQALGGSITQWFENKQRARAGATQSTTTAYTPSANPYATPAYTTPAYATASDSQSIGAPTTVQYYDAQTGTRIAPNPPSYAPPPATDTSVTAETLYAGLAYEVHAVAPNGIRTPVNPATHEFRTGDQFVVYYRPTLPGRILIDNINPLGRSTRIDAVDVAAGQLAELGPYEFAAQRGDEQLRLTLQPCTSAPMTLATRDIVKAGSQGATITDSYALPATATGSFALSACDSPATRSLAGAQTRDTRKVAVDGTTGFALDPLSSTEYSTGEVDPRAITIVFRHR
jgi:hypothetical protein